MNITTVQAQALRQIEAGQFGADTHRKTLASIKARGLVEYDASPGVHTYVLTNAGRAALEG